MELIYFLQLHDKTQVSLWGGDWANSCSNWWRFSKIPEDLKTEYFDLIDEKNRIEVWAEKEINYIKESRKHKLDGNLNALEANYKKMLSCGRIDLNDLLTRLRKRGKK